MANTSRRGLWPVGTLTGAPWQGSLRVMDIDAAAENIFVGDPVRLETDGGINTLAAVYDVNTLGVVVGVLPVSPPNPGDTLALAGSTEVPLALKHSAGAGKALVCVARDAIYEIESNAVIDGIANIGQTANFGGLTAGSTTTGLSGVFLAGDSLGVAATAAVKIVGLKRSPDNELGAANAKVYVVLNATVTDHRTAGI